MRLSYAPRITVLFFAIGMSQIVVADIMGDNVPRGIVWLLVMAAAAIHWLRVRRRDPAVADEMGMMVGMLVMVLAQALTH